MSEYDDGVVVWHVRALFAEVVVVVDAKKVRSRRVRALCFAFCVGHGRLSPKCHNVGVCVNIVLTPWRFRLSCVFCVCACTSTRTISSTDTWIFRWIFSSRLLVPAMTRTGDISDKLHGIGERGRNTACFRQCHNLEKAGMSSYATEAEAMVNAQAASVVLQTRLNLTRRRDRKVSVAEWAAAFARWQFCGEVRSHPSPRADGGMRRTISTRRALSLYASALCARASV